MIYPVVAGLLAIVAALVVFFGLRLLFDRHWLLGWLRGMFGFSCVAFAVVVALAAWDLRGYLQMRDDQPVATLTFNRLEPQRYSITLALPNAVEQRVELDGDLWQLDVHVLRWSTYLTGLGLKPGYRLNRMSGRYLALEDDQRKPHSEVSLQSEPPRVDAWFWLHRINQRFTPLEAQSTSVTYQPMADGAVFTIGLTAAGLVAKPLNDRAKVAVSHWE